MILIQQLFFTKRYPYTPRRGAPSNIIWPPKGLELKVYFKPPKSSNLDFGITIHYEIFDNVPFLTKWITVSTANEATVSFDAIEILSVNHQWSGLNYHDYDLYRKGQWFLDLEKPFLIELLLEIG